MMKNRQSFYLTRIKKSDADYNRRVKIMKEFNKNFLPEEIKYNGKLYTREMFLSSQLNQAQAIILAPVNSIIVNVLPRNLVGKTNLHGHEYKPTRWLFTVDEKVEQKIITGRTIRIKIPTIDQVEIIVECFPEDMCVKGNAMASGDNKIDTEAENKIYAQLDAGNRWAWCYVKVTVKWRGVEAFDGMGGCSYVSREEFLKDNYYEDMRQTAYKELVAKIESLRG